MIAENHYLIPHQVKQKYAETDKYLIVVTDLKASDNERVDPIIDRITKLKDQVHSQIKDVRDLVIKNDQKT